MLKVLGLAALTVGLLYLAGVRPAGIKHQIELQRQQHATVPALGDDRSDWG